MTERLAGTLPTLTVVEGRANTDSVALDRPLIRIGRSSKNDLVLDDDQVSRAHAEVSFQDGRFVVADLKSRNGVFVDKARVVRAPLSSGSRIRIGNTELQFAQDLPTVTEAQRLALIERSEVLRPLPAETKQAIARTMAVRVFPRNCVIVAQGAAMESILFVVSGEIRIVEQNDEGGERAVGRLGPGDHFGERGLLPGQSGNSALLAEGVVVALELPQADLGELMKQRPGQAATVLVAVRDLLKAAGEAPPAKTADAQLARRDSFHNLAACTDVEIVGEDKRLQTAKKKVETLAKEGKPLLIAGPSGCGKRTFARHWHQHSPQAAEPYVEVSLTEIEAGAVDAALFGVEANADAAHMSGRTGYLEMLGGGTLAIVHAERLDAHQQSKLATYLKLGWFHRVYGQASVKAKTRVVLVADGDEAAVGAGLVPALKAEVEGRIVSLTPLTSRLKDIPILAEHFLKLHAKREGKRITALSREAQDVLVSYSWPGNIPELDNVIHRAVIIAAGGESLSAEAIIVVPSKDEARKVNLLRSEGLRSVLRKRWVLASFTWINILFIGGVFLLTLLGGVLPLFFPGHPLGSFEHNFGMLVTWLVWFPVLPITAVLMGRVWCTVCPIVGIGDFASKVVKFNVTVPKFLKRLDFWTVAVAFLFLDYIEELIGVADVPLATAGLLVAIVGGSVVMSVIFERKAFCRHVCPLAGLLGTYATMSPLEIRGNKKVCQTQCGQHSCFKGTDNVDGCPLASYPASISNSYECMMCGNCIRSCDNRGVQLNIRPPLSEMWHRPEPLLSMSLFAMALVALMALHQFSNLAFWKGIEGSLGLPWIVLHTLVFSAFLLLAIVPFAMSSMLSAAASSESVGKNMALYGLTFVPLAFAGHMAHLGHEILGEGLFTLLSFFKGLFALIVQGTPLADTVAIAPFIPPVVVTILKVMLVLGGAIGSLVALVMVARKAAPQMVFARILPHAALLFVFWLGYTAIFVSSTEVAPAAAPPAEAATAASPAPQPTPAARPSPPIVRQPTQPRP